VGLFSSAETTERFDDARSFIERAAEVLEGTRSRWKAVALGGLAILGAQEGRLQDALAHFEGALRLWSEEMDSGKEATTHFKFAMHAEFALLLLELGREEDARSQFRSAFEAAHDLGARTHALLEHYFGGYLHWRGDLTAAVAAYRKVVRSREAGALYQPLVLGALGAALAASGEIDEATAAFDQAESIVAIEAGRVALSVQRAHLDLARSRACAQEGDEAGRVMHMERARERFSRAASLPRASCDVRLARATLRAALARANGGASVQAGVLEVAADGAWFCVDGKRRVSLRHRQRLQQLLQALVGARQQRPGRPLTVDDACAAVWPGERIVPAAARRRVQVAISTLRAAGLRGVLQSDVRGYRLDPAILLSVTGEPAESPRR